ncbi:MAG: hypothetical protein CMP51_00685 [Flavobacteriales bacterium]|nr:hypothetical protein [Flavobacteriales bacterium]|tara:strand:+ start:122 stop:835 length:714 start_codon:yes stop_codon:yes gene_type:complete
MDSNMLYMKILIFSSILPIIFSFNKKVYFYDKWKYFFPANIIVAIPFLLWDSVFTNMQVWHFGEKQIIGPEIINLPIEEVLFFILIPFCCIFSYEVIKNHVKILKLSQKTALNISLVLAVTSFLITISARDFLYTSVTCGLLSCVLLISYFQQKTFLKDFFRMYIVISLIPFIIVNGLLTGILENNILEATVMYNDQERYLGRFLTIPIEDFFYSMLLLISNVWLYEYFKSKKEKSN